MISVMSVFGELPPVLREIEESYFRTLYYEHDIRTFVIGNREIQATDDSVVQEFRFPKGEPVPKELISSHPALLGLWGDTLATPKFYTWLNDQPKDVFTETSRVMKQVFEDVLGDALDGGHHDKMHPFGFSASLLRKGHLNLSVLGNCACLGSNPNGHTVDSDEWDTGYVEMTTHNIDTKPQYVSIMAGLGHLALRCGDDTF